LTAGSPKGKCPLGQFRFRQCGSTEWFNPEHGSGLAPFCLINPRSPQAHHPMGSLAIFLR
jgi:hypothetical protein